MSKPPVIKHPVIKPQIRVLIVEDDLVDRMACRRALAQDTEHEYVLFEAETSREGLQLAHAQKPDCVLLDYHLPDMNGLEFLAELRNDLGEIAVPVMMLTGADNASVAVEAMKRGAQDYLVKDVNRQYLELLPAVIQRVLRERRTLVEKKQAEENLAQAEAMYRFLVGQIPAIIYTTTLDAPGTLLYISPQIRQLGFSPEEWLADPEGLLKQIHPEDRELVREVIARGYESGEPLRCEYRLLSRAGKVRWFLNEANLVRHQSGEPLFLQGVLVDITQNKEAEAELHVHRRRIEELVSNRTMQFKKQTAILESAKPISPASLKHARRPGARSRNTPISSRTSTTMPLRLPLARPGRRIHPDQRYRTQVVWPHTRRGCGQDEVRRSAHARERQDLHGKLPTLQGMRLGA